LNSNTKAALMNKKLIRITTVPMALKYLLPGQMKFMAANGFDVVMISADGKELPDVLANEQCRHIIVPMTRKITPVQDLKCLWQLVRIFKKEKPDIVHTHTPKAGLLGMMAAKLSGVKVRIHTVAGLPMMVEKGNRYRLLKAIEKITYRAATQIWPNSYSLLQFIKDNHLAAEKKLQVIASGSSNGINIDRFNKAALKTDVLENIRTAIKFNSQHIYLLCIGRLVADKGIVELVNVFTRLQKTSPDLKLLLVGLYEPQLDPLPQETLQQVESNPGIIHIDWSNEVEYYMSIADVFVFPSHREGFPNVLLQAGAMELPVVCSRIAGNVDIVNNGQTGLLFEKGNETEMYSSVSFALANMEQMKSMAQNLLHIIKNDYRRENIWQHILSAYQILLNNKK